MTSCSLFRALRLGVPGLFAAVVLVSCGGGVESGGTGGPQVLASGTAAGLGSVFVDGVEFGDDTAVIQDEYGQTLAQTQLQVGMLMRVDATPVLTSSSASTSTALSIQVQREIVGPVDSVNPAGTSMVVLGQAVRITPATWLDPALVGGVAAVSMGQVLDIYGQYDALLNQYVATRVVASVGYSAYALRGILTAVDTTQQTLGLGGLTISYASVPAASLPNLKLGHFVRVRLAEVPVNQVWSALSVVEGAQSLPDRPDVRVVARVSAWTSDLQFSVNGVVVDATNATFPNGQSGIVLGARLKVTGSSAAGVLVADTVTVLGDETAANSIFQARGPITAIDTTAQTLTVKGLTVHYGASTRFVAGTAAGLALGVLVDVSGGLDADRTSIDAQTVTFE